MDWIKVLLVSTLSFAVLFLIAKFVGHKQIAQLDFFDYVTGITVGSIAAEMATELEQPWRPLLAMLVYGLISLLLGFLMSRYQRSRKYINGTPSILFDKGKLYRANLKKAKLDLSEFMVLCRQQGYFDLNAIRTAVFEYNGKLSILPVSQSRPLTPEDLQLAPEQEDVLTELIMDGRILEENLKRMGLDLTWLSHQLAEQGFHHAREIFLAVCDRKQTLRCYPCGD